MSIDGVNALPVKPLSTLQHDERQAIWDEAQDTSERRALIEQTKGMLMFVYGISADEAFDVLRQQSQQHNVKLRVVAEHILQDLMVLTRARHGPARQTTFNGVMLAAHERISRVAARTNGGT